jgi:hypothetical protein
MEFNLGDKILINWNNELTEEMEVIDITNKENFILYTFRIYENGKKGSTSLTNRDIETGLEKGYCTIKKLEI